MESERSSPDRGRNLQILDRYVAALNTWMRHTRDVWLRLGIGAWFRRLLEAITLAVLSIWTALSRVFAKLLLALRWLLLPKGDTPFDVLKHYLSVICGVIVLGALIWAGKQIAYPPLVITLAETPEPLRKEHWLNLEISRALMNQIERIRDVVRGERDPTFEAVLNPPNIVVKSGEFSFNVQEQLLTPLGSLLGRSQGEVHLALTCYHPGCLRTVDSDCRTPVFASVDGGGRTDNPAATPPPQAPPAHQYLCLRVTADIRRGGMHKRSTTRLVLNNDTYTSDTTAKMGEFAEAITMMADPATAALYFYRRAQGTPARSSTSDPALLDELRELSTDLRGKVFAAAALAEAQDANSACLAQALRARMAIDQREFSLAETYIARAKNIPRWRHLRHLSLPIDCGRLIANAEIALARRLAIPTLVPTYPPHPHDNNKQRRQAAFERATNILTELGGGANATWMARIEKGIKGSDQADAVAFARAEIALRWFTKTDHCHPLIGTGSADESDDEKNPKELDFPKAQALEAIQLSVKAIEALKPGRRMGLLARQAALDFSEQLARNKKCLDTVTSLAERLYLGHPDDPSMARLLARLIETSALAEAGEEDESKRTHFNRARRLYERMVETGDNKTDVFTLGRIAFIGAAFAADSKIDDESLTGPPTRPLGDAKRAWQRFQRELYPPDVRHYAEEVLALWGSLLLTSYSQAVVTAEIAKKTADPRERDAAEKAVEFVAAVRMLFPAEPPKTLADFTRIRTIGPRIGCLCLLRRMAADEANATEFYFGIVDKWQRRPFGLPGITACSRDLLPHDRRHATFARKEAALDNAKKLCHVPAVSAS
jgi:hypothetical protein